jgi:predicted AlkP superfamily phosphohydrolase/phosphomutase
MPNLDSSNRVLIIGLDGAEWNVLEPWLADGTLPHLSSLRQRGVSGNLVSSVPPLSAPAWSNLMTGKRPGKHGVFHFVNVFDESQEAEPQVVNARSIKSPTIWDVLAHCDRKVGVINVPMTYPPRPVNGFLITGLLTPRNAPVFTYPEELAQELGDYVIDLDRFMGRKPFQDEHDYDADATSPTLALIQDFKEMLNRRASASLALMETRPWDAFMVVFTGTDRLGHYFWPYHHPSDDANAQRLYEAIRDYYVRLDQVVGELVEKAGDDVAVVILSDHGMGPVYSRRAHWNAWLNRKGWLVTQESAAGALNVDRWLRRLRLPRDTAGRILSRLPTIARSRAVRRAAGSFSATIDKVRSKAYAVQIYSYVFGIRINATGAEKEQLREQLIAELNALTDRDTGKRIVQRVYLGEEYFQGPYAVNIPDLIVITDPDYTSGFNISHYSGLATPIESSRTNMGDHRMEGIFLLCGAPFIPRQEGPIELNIEDIAPTALHLMGLPIPSDMDGKVPAEVFGSRWLEAHPVGEGEPMQYWPSETEALSHDQAISSEDEEQIKERLRALGYI